MRILVVDDEESLCEILQFNLEVEGYTVDVAYSAEQALELDLTVYDLMLLDVMMGPMSGFKLAQLLKRNPQTAHIPIIFCTAKDTENDTVAGLTLGADDYISKPFSIREVVARVKSVLRRTSSGLMAESSAVQETPTGPTATVSSGTASAEANAPTELGISPAVSSGASCLCVGTLVADLDQKICRIGSEEVTLTKKEFEILVLLLKNKGRILSREEILNTVWGNEVIVLDRTVDVNITRLRKKIGEYGDLVETRLGYGYGFKA